MDKLSKGLIAVSGITTIFIITIFLLIIATGIIMLVLVYQKKQLQFIREKEQLKVTYEKTLLQSQLEIKEQTLQHISYELHDNLGQIASIIKINLNTLQFEDIPAAKEKIEDTKELVRQLITDLKSLAINLSSDRVAQLGIIKGLETEVQRLNKTGQFEASFVQHGNIPELDNNTTIILYRMAQEIINNMVKHSGAKHINISAGGIDNLFTLAISDDGVGFNVPEKMNSGEGSGLINLQNRAKLINAELKIESTPVNGTTVTIQFPI